MITEQEGILLGSSGYGLCLAHLWRHILVVARIIQETKLSVGSNHECVDRYTTQSNRSDHTRVMLEK